MIEASSDLIDYWKEGGGGGSAGAETMLGVGYFKGIKLGKEEPLQHLDCRGE